MSIKREQGRDVDRANDIPYSLDVIHNSIRAAEINIATFEDAIKKEREDVGKFKWMIEVLESGDLEKIKQIPYTADALKGGVKTAEEHIATFEQSIANEKTLIDERKWMIEVLEKKQARKEELEEMMNHTAEVNVGEH